jgi:hypothetical protein
MHEVGKTSYRHSRTDIEVAIRERDLRGRTSGSHTHVCDALGDVGDALDGGVKALKERILLYKSAEERGGPPTRARSTTKPKSSVGQEV